MVGATSYRIGSFSKEPIAGVTPMSKMLQINEFDKIVPEQDPASTAKTAGVEKTSTRGISGGLESYAQLLQPIDAPFVFSGFSEATLKQFAPRLTAAGIVPVMGVGASSDAKQPEPLVPAPAASAVLVRSDMDVAPTSTVPPFHKPHPPPP